MARNNGNISSSGASPRPLGKPGKDLWDRICCDFVLQDETERETLCQICEAQDHVADLSAAIKKEGPFVETDKGTTKAHPAYGTIRQYKIFVVRMLERLKSHHKPTKLLGRPARTAMGVDDPWGEGQS
jgi:P27 family predicted phage terminase small subunit